MIQALIDGERGPEVLASQARCGGAENARPRTPTTEASSVSSKRCYTGAPSSGAVRKRHADNARLGFADRVQEVPVLPLVAISATDDS
jgi:hypothetical protein